MKKVDKGTLVITLILTGLGLVMVYSSSAFAALREMNSSTFFLRKQLIPLTIGAILVIAMAKTDYHLWGKCSYLILAITALSLLAVLLFGPNIHGAKRWIKFANFSIQPSEFAKLAVVIFIADFCAREDIHNLKKGLLPVLGVTAVILLLVGMQPSFGVLSILIIVSLILLFLGGVKTSHLLILLAVAAGVGYIFVNQFAYAKTRIASFFSQEEYQLRQSIYGIGCGGLFGKGLGNGQEKLLFLPYPHTDFIFSIIGEELGFIGCAGVSILFLLLLIKGIKVGIHSQDLFGFLLASGISLVIFTSACFHIGVALGILPTTGIPLPLISFGGSNLVSNLAGLGILLNISRNETHNT